MGKQNVAYLRVSTDAQTEKYGLDMQKQKIMEYCKKNEITIDKWYVDGGYSGSNMDRPKIQELISDVKKGVIRNILIYKLDRISRDVIDTLNLVYKIFPKHDVNIVSMTEEIRTDTPLDEFVVTMNAAMNGYERKVMRMRMSAGMVERVRKGYWMGGGRVPFGYYYDRNDGILHPNESEAEIVRKAYELYIDGYSCEKIAKILDLKRDVIVMNILKRKSNIGIIKYRGEEYMGLHEPIVSEKTFYKAQECMKKRHTNSHINNENILSGLCYCGKCGARMRYQKWGKYHKLVCYSQYKSGKEYMKKDPNCDNIRPNAHDIEYEVEDCFRDFSINIEESNQYESKRGIIEDSIKKSNSKIKKYYSLYAENDSENLLELIKEEEERVKNLKKELEEEIGKEHIVDGDMVEKIKKISDVWDSLSGREKNKVLKECIEKIIITDDDLDIYFITF